MPAELILILFDLRPHWLLVDLANALDYTLPPLRCLHTLYKITCHLQLTMPLATEFCAHRKKK
jgi:hypothetical protein